MFEIKARLRQSGRVQWRDFYEYLDRRMLRGGGLEEEQGGDFWGGLKTYMELVGVRGNDAEDLEGQMVAGEKHLRLGRCVQAVRTMRDTTTPRLSQTVPNTKNPCAEIMTFFHIPKEPTAQPQPWTLYCYCLQPPHLHTYITPCLDMHANT